LLTSLLHNIMNVDFVGNILFVSSQNAIVNFIPRRWHKLLKIIRSKEKNVLKVYVPNTVLE
jgi:hypothetical protein